MSGLRSRILALACALSCAGCHWDPLPLLFAGIPAPGQPPRDLPIEAPVQIRFDRFGIPHIRAETDRDLYFALGYVHGRDRLAELSYMRLSSRGELASVFGPGYVDADIATRGLKLDERVAVTVAKMSAALRANLESYVAGINTWATPFGLPFEFIIVGGVPEQWTVEDTVRVALWTAAELQQYHHDIDTTASLALGLGQEVAEEFFGQSFGDITYLTSKPLMPALPTRPRATPTGGSNNWAVAGSRTASGLPLLANDPHLRITFPSAWYLVALDTPTRSFRGALQPGVPLFVAGTNGRVSFGVTLTYFPLRDTYAELLDGTQTRYLVDGAWRDLRFETWRLAVFGEAAPRTIVQPFTHRGPLRQGPAGLHLSDRWWVGDLCQDLAASFQLLAASSVEEAMQAVRHMEVFSFNYVFADVNDNIGWQTTGRIPRRSVDGYLLPLDGTRSTYDWDTFFFGPDLPSEPNPPRGFVATANHRPTVSTSELPSGLFASPYRIRRIEQLLSVLQGAASADMARIQQDVCTRQFAVYRAAILDAAGLDPRADEVISVLAAWDGCMSPDSRGAVLFDTFLSELTQLVLLERLPAELGLDTTALRTLEEFENNWPGILGDPDSCFWSAAPVGPQAEGIPAQRAVVALALTRAAEQAPAGTWGDVNQYRIRHPLSSLFPWLSPWLGLPVAPAPGGRTTVYMNDVATEGGASLRVIVDMSRPGELQAVLPTGQSGRPESPNSRDQYELWLRGEYLTLPSPPDVDDIVIELTPGHVTTETF